MLGECNKENARNSHVSTNGIGYDILDIIGEGTFAVVYKARCKKTNKIVSLKKIKLDTNNEGITATTIREMSILHELDHPNIIKLKHIITTKQNDLYLVFNIMECDLRKYTRIHLKQLAPSKKMHHIKVITKRTLLGIKYLHDHGIVHRDLKTQNILIDSNSLQVKVADFGLARSLTAINKNLTRDIVTLWYRAPEILLGKKKYNSAIDIWSIGCILLEMIIHEPPFRGDCEWAVMMEIFKMCGTPSERDWQDMKDMEYYSNRFPMFRSTLKENLERNPHIIALIGNDTIDLLCQLLELNPNDRVSAAEALESPFFDSIRDQTV